MKFIFPVKNYLTITQGFHSGHVGNDYGWTSRVAGGNNQPIVASEDGTVTTAVDGYGNTYPNSKIYGNYVIITHADGYYTLYGHLLKGVPVKVGQKVKKGDTIGFMGNSGYSLGQHLHYEVRKGGNSKSFAIDPLTVCMLEGNGVTVSGTTLYPERIKKRTGYVGTPVERDTTRLQIEVTIDNLNARSFASVNADRLGYANKGVYNVQSEPKKAGDYLFTKLKKMFGWLIHSIGQRFIHQLATFMTSRFMAYLQEI